MRKRQKQSKSSFKNWIDYILGGIMRLGIFKPKLMPEDPQKIQDKIRELNASTPGQFWITVQENHALTKVDFRNGKVVFFPSSGVIIKIFFNRSTGEIRIFPAKMFEQK